MRMLRFLIAALCLLAMPAIAQQATVTATITSAWAGGSVVATFIPQGGGIPSVRQVSGVINSAGSFSLLAWQNTYATYAPSLTQFTICVGAQPPTCYTATVQITSSSQNISSAFSAAPSPSVYDPSAGHSITAAWSSIGISGTWKIRDLWAHASEGSSATSYTFTAPAWGSTMLVLSH